MAVIIQETLSKISDIKKVTANDVAGWLLEIKAKDSVYYIKVNKGDVIAMAKHLNTNTDPLTVQVNVHTWDGEGVITKLGNMAVVTVKYESYRG